MPADALKLAEEALEPFENDGMDRSRDPRTKAIQLALDHIRSARAEWGWRPIAEMEQNDDQEPLTVGKWDLDVWHYEHDVACKGWAVRRGYTHFYRPQLPPPPAREDVGNG